MPWKSWECCIELQIPVDFYCIWYVGFCFACQKGAMTPMEVCEGLGLFELKNRKWHIQGTCALRGDGLYEGLDWLSGTLKEMRAAGYSSVGTSSF